VPDFAWSGLAVSNDGARVRRHGSGGDCVLYCFLK
jgi:hypothetical protein